MRWASVVARSTYQASSGASGQLEGLADVAERPAELHHRGCVGAAEPLGEHVGRQGAGQDGEDLVPLAQRPSEYGGRRADRGHAGDDLARVPVGQPLVHVHVGAVEQRIALGQYDDVAARVEMRGEPRGAVGVEVVHRALVAAGMISGLGGQRVDQVLLELAVPQVRRCHRAGDAPAVTSTVERDHVGGPDQPGRLHRHQFGIARSQSDTPQPSGHSSSLAIALTAAAVIALPPRRPRTTRYSRPRLVRRQCVLGLGRADEPDRDAEDRGRSWCAVPSAARAAGTAWSERCR